MKNKFISDSLVPNRKKSSLHSCLVMQSEEFVSKDKITKFQYKLPKACDSPQFQNPPNHIPESSSIKATSKTIRNKLDQNKSFKISSISTKISIPHVTGALLSLLCLQTSFLPIITAKKSQKTFYTEYGPVIGTIRETSIEDVRKLDPNTGSNTITQLQSLQFLGIPYAAPPKKYLRWAKPQSPAKWTKAITCDRYKPICPQDLSSQTRLPNLLPKIYDNIGSTFKSDIVDTDISEDCLYLNVFVPNEFMRKQSNSPNKYTKTLPVMVHLHGYTFNDGGSTWYDATYRS